MTNLYRTPPKSSEYIHAKLEQIERVSEPPGPGPVLKQMAAIGDFEKVRDCRAFQKYLLRHGIFSELHRGDGKWEALVDPEDRVRAEDVLKGRESEPAPRSLGPWRAGEEGPTAKSLEFPPRLASAAAATLVVSMGIAVLVAQVTVGMAAALGRNVVSPLVAAAVIGAVGIFGGYALGLFRAASSPAERKQLIFRDVVLLIVALLGALAVFAFIFGSVARPQ